MRGTVGKDGHVDVDEVIEEKSKEPKILLVSFAGSTFLPGGFPRAEFQTVLSMAAERCGVLHRTDCLFLVDPSVTFYLKSSKAKRFHSLRHNNWTGWDELEEKINRLIRTRQYDKVILVGSSMGATAILALCGRIQCDKVVVFNPLVDLVRESRSGFWVGGTRLPEHIRTRMPNIIAEQCWKSTAKILVHSSKRSPADVAQLMYLENAILAHHDNIADNFCRKKMRRADPVLEAVWHDTDKHVLPRELKKRSRLLPLLEKALRETLQE